MWIYLHWNTLVKLLTIWHCYWLVLFSVFYISIRWILNRLILHIILNLCSLKWYIYLPSTFIFLNRLINISPFIIYCILYGFILILKHISKLTNIQRSWTFHCRKIYSIWWLFLIKHIICLYRNFLIFFLFLYICHIIWRIQILPTLIRFFIKSKGRITR